MASACGFTQVVDKPMAELCSKVISVPAGCSDHNLVALARRTKTPKPGLKVIMKRTYENFDQLKVREEVSGLCWSDVLMETNPDSESALMKFNNVFMKVVEKHEPMKKFTVKSISTPRLDNELKEDMIELDKKKLYNENRIKESKNNSRKVWSTLNSLIWKES